MSISNSLQRAARIQEKIDLLREQLSGLLEKARAELAADADADVALHVPPSQPKKQKLARGSRQASVKEEDQTGRGKRAGVRRGRRPSTVGQKRPASPTGPLAPAVVKVLRMRRKPMRVQDILSSLLANGYQFNSPEPKKNLAARIYRLKGVKQVDAGLFGLA